MKKAAKEDQEAQRAEKAAEKKKAEKAAEKKKAEKKAEEERIEKAKVSTSESGEVTDDDKVVSTERTSINATSIDVVVDTVTPSAGSPKVIGGEVDVKA